MSLNSQEQIINIIAEEIITKGNNELGGMEQEIMTLDSEGHLIPHSDFHQEFIKTAIKEAERFDNQPAKIKYGECLLGGNMIIGGEVSYGSFNPETSTLITEFAHAAATDAWHTFNSSNKAIYAVTKAADKLSYNIVGSGMIPNADLDDIRKSGAVLPYAGYRFSYENMRLNKNRHISQTTFGNSSFHYNQGFSNPEAFTQFARAALYIQPIITAVTANSPIIKGEIFKDENNRNVKTARSLKLLSYENYFNFYDLSYAYPDFMLNFDNKFADVVKGYMSQPLGRTFVNGVKTEVGSLTMAEYSEKGFELGGERYYPERNSIEMMFSEPIIDVRLRPFSAPRVEARAHDGSPNIMCAAISAFYRGINANIDAVEDYLKETLSPNEVRRQRRDVCYTALDGFAHLKDGQTIPYAELANNILQLSHQGLIYRDLGEEHLLQPIEAIVTSGKTYADRQIEFLEACGGRIKDEHMADFMMQFNYASTIMPNGRSFIAPFQPEQKLLTLSI